MARMLGRNRHYPCPAADCTRCRSCGDGNETRAFKRREQRELGREFAEFAGEAAERAELTLPAALETLAGIVAGNSR